MNYFAKINLFKLSKLFLACLIFSINIREPFFHTREIFFTLFMVTSLKFANFQQIYKPMLLFGIWSITSLFNFLIPGSNIQIGITTVIASIYLLLMCFSEKKYSDTIIKSYIASSSVIGISIVILWLICFISPDIYSILRVFFAEFNESRNIVTFYVDIRNILGFFFITANYRTSVCMIGALAYCLLMRLYQKKTYTILILLFSVALFFTGTRANMLISFSLLFFYKTFVWLKNKRFLSALFLALATSITILTLTYMFLYDPNSNSSEMKLLDNISYYNVFKTDINRTLFWGWGEGSTFYSLARRKMIDMTEISYLVNIRRFGLLATITIFLVIWLDQLILFFIKSKNGIILKVFYLIAIGGYVCVACSNPFLIDSIGFCSLFFFQTLLKCRAVNYFIGGNHNANYFNSDDNL